MICACLPSLNALFTRRVSNTNSSKTGDSTRPEHELSSRVRQGERGSKGPLPGKKSGYMDIGSDQVYLFSDAEGTSTSEVDAPDSDTGAIRKTVNVSHSVDYVRYNEPKC